MNELERLQPSLPSDIEELLASARRVTDSFPAVHAGVRARLQSALPGAWPLGAPPNATRALRGLGARLLTPLAAFGLGAGVGAAFQAKRMAPPPVLTSPAALAPPAPLPTLLAVPVPAPLPTPAARPPVVPKPAATVAQPPAPQRAAVDIGLAEEDALLERARAALARGQAAAALEALDLHAQRFAEGRLAEERAALRVQALAQSGQRESARGAAAAFHRRYPDSLLTGAVDSSLEGIP